MGSVQWTGKSCISHLWLAVLLTYCDRVLQCAKAVTHVLLSLDLSGTGGVNTQHAGDRAGWQKLKDLMNKLKHD